MIVWKRAVAKNCDWICSFWILLDLLGFFSLIQTSIPIVPCEICVKIAFFSWSSFLLWDRFVTGTYWNRKKFPSSEGLPAHCWQKNRNKNIHAAKVAWKNGSTSEKEKWRRLEGKNPTKWHWEKRQLTLRSWQDRGSTKWLWDFYMFYKIMSALVWSFFD